MKRQLKLDPNEGRYRVINVSLDVVIPADKDGSNIPGLIEETINEAYDGGGFLRIAAGDVGGDITDIYERDYPDELFI